MIGLVLCPNLRQQPPIHRFDRVGRRRHRAIVVFHGCGPPQRIVAVSFPDLRSAHLGRNRHRSADARSRWTADAWVAVEGGKRAPIPEARVGIRLAAIPVVVAVRTRRGIAVDRLLDVDTFFNCSLGDRLVGAPEAVKEALRPQSLGRTVLDPYDVLLRARAAPGDILVRSSTPFGSLHLLRATQSVVLGARPGTIDIPDIFGLADGIIPRRLGRVSEMVGHLDRVEVVDRIIVRRHNTSSRTGTLPPGVHDRHLVSPLIVSKLSLKLLRIRRRGLVVPHSRKCHLTFRRLPHARPKLPVRPVAVVAVPGAR